MRKTNLREVQKAAQSHTASQGQRWESNPGKLNPGPSSKGKTSEAVWEGKWNIPISLKKECPSMHGEGLWVPDGLAGGFLSPSSGHGVAPWRRLRDWLSVHLRWVRPGFLWERAGCDHPVPTRNIWLLQVSLPKGLIPLTPKEQLGTATGNLVLGNLRRNEPSVALN